MTVPPPRPRVRTATSEDLPRVRATWAAAGVAALPADELAAVLDRDPGLLLVAEVTDVAGARVVGTVLGTFDGRRGWLHRLAVDPAHRRRGIAGALVDEVEQRLADRGAPRVNLLVLPDNPAALGFWAARGYAACPDVLHTAPAPRPRGGARGSGA